MKATGAPARYLVGIDLGTTHTVVAYADTASDSACGIQPFLIEQLVAAGEVSARNLLPSVRYHPAEGELSPADTCLPWRGADALDPNEPVLGEFARSLGAKSHGRLVASAKSWLSHPAVDRMAAILPWGAPQGIAKVSPVEASASYLAHVRCAWNFRFPDCPLESQEVVLTVPASFDEGARVLTVEAARSAGLGTVHLLEEPQAACYDWLWEHRDGLVGALAGIRSILVCDVGGGTTDFTLIRVETGQDPPTLTRVGVGNHLMLGGDNIDLTLAHRVEERLGLGQGRLTSAELAQLVDQCRLAKERLLFPDAPDTVSVTLLGSGSRLIGGARSVTLDRVEVQAVVLDGFFPMVERSARPDRKRSAVVEFGLPYAADPAISRHAAAFLAQQAGRKESGEGEPDAVLLNGGMFRSALIAERLMALLSSWRTSEPKRLRNDRPDQAVAFGAVAYGLARRGIAVDRIRGGSARSYFLAVDTDHASDRCGVCVLPRGTDEGMQVVLAERRFQLKLGQPVRFQLFSCTDDVAHRGGDLVPIDPERFVELPPLAVAFDDASGEEFVHLVGVMTEVGTLELRCVSERDNERSWNVEFLLRRTGPVSVHGGSVPPGQAQAEELIRLAFGKKVKNRDPKAVKVLRSALERELGPRERWHTGVCRTLFAILLEGLPHRRRSPDHERLWLNLTGYCLRPGFGDPVDDWRVAQLWEIYPQGLQFVGETQNWAEWWTLWRRIAGGLPADAQSRIFDDVADYINPAAARRANLGALAKKRAYEDMVRLAASLERLAVSRKIELGTWLMERLRKPGEPIESWWALGRVGSRVPFHGSVHGVVPRATAQDWMNELLAAEWKKNLPLAFAATLIARKSGDRDRDIDATLAEDVVVKLRVAKAPESWLGLVTEVQQLDAAEEKRVFGEALPPGLTLVH